MKRYMRHPLNRLLKFESANGHAMSDDAKIDAARKKARRAKTALAIYRALVVLGILGATWFLRSSAIEDRENLKRLILTGGPK